MAPPTGPGCSSIEVAVPILLAWRLHQQNDALGLFDPRVMIVRAAAYLILQGPVTGQERWEENAGYSPSTLASGDSRAGLRRGLGHSIWQHGAGGFHFRVCRLAGGARRRMDSHNTGRTWCQGFPATTSGSIPPIAEAPDPHADPNTTMIQIANGGGLHPARNVVGGDFLHLVRYGIRSPNDPIVRDSIEVIDRVLKRDLPQGPGWRRYNHDGYGQKDDGSAFDGTEWAVAGRF